MRVVSVLQQRQPMSIVRFVSLALIASTDGWPPYVECTVEKDGRRYTDVEPMPAEMSALLADADLSEIVARHDLHELRKQLDGVEAEVIFWEKDSETCGKLKKRRADLAAKLVEAEDAFFARASEARKVNDDVLRNALATVRTRLQTHLGPETGHDAAEVAALTSALDAGAGLYGLGAGVAPTTAETVAADLGVPAAAVKVVNDDSKGGA